MVKMLKRIPALFVLCLLLLPAVPVKAQVMLCTAGVNCTVMAGVKKCTKTFNAFAMSTTTMTVMNNVIACNHTTAGTIIAGYTIKFIASAMTNSPPPTRTCSWMWTNANGANVCIINLADGLPVELMDFSVESEDDSSTEQDKASE